MSGSALRSRDRQRLRADVEAAVAGLPTPYVLEAVAKQLNVRDGVFEVRLREGFLLDVTRVRCSIELRLRDGRVIPAFGNETFTAAGLWERPPRASRRVGKLRVKV